MSGKRKTSGKQMSMEFVVGLFFTIGITILGVYTIIIGGDAFTQKKFDRQIDFAQVSGVGVGNNVLLRGVSVGTVSEMYVPEESPDRVRIVIKLKRDYVFHEDYTLEIRNSSVLGGSFIYLELGDTDKPAIGRDEVLQGTVPVDVFAEAGRLVKKLNSTMLDIQSFAKALANGKSTISRLVNEDGLYNDAVTAFQTITDAGKKLGAAIDEMKTIKGSVEKTLATFQAEGKKIGTAADSVKAAADAVTKTADSITKTSDGIDGVITDARGGKGVVGKLLTDEKMYADFAEAVANVKEIAKKASDGKSSIGKIFNDDGELYASIKGAFDTVDGTFTGAKDIMDKVNKGEGTIGKLVYDETVWRDLKQAIKDIQGAIDDFREQAPILTFGSFIFGSL